MIIGPYIWAIKRCTIACKQLAFYIVSVISITSYIQCPSSCLMVSLSFRRLFEITRSQQWRFINVTDELFIINDATGRCELTSKLLYTTGFFFKSTTYLCSEILATSNNVCSAEWELESKTEWSAWIIWLNHSSLMWYSWYVPLNTNVWFLTTPVDFTSP